MFLRQESLQSEKDIKQTLTPTSRPDLERESVNPLLLQKAAVALPGDALGKTTIATQDQTQTRNTAYLRSRLQTTLLYSCHRG